MVAAWKSNFQQLVQAGTAAIPAIRAFLEQNQESAFDSNTARAVGARSARLAAFDALRQIGGPEAVAIMEGTLTTTSAPREIAALAWELDALAEGQYRPAALARSRAVLAEMAVRQPPEVDVAPLFEVYGKYGDGSVVPELEKAASQWRYYAFMALGNLPDNAGVPSLIRFATARFESDTRLTAIETLAQLSAQNEEARQTLLTLAGTKQIPSHYWPYVTPALRGDERFPVDGVLTTYPAVQSWSEIGASHVRSGNQNLYRIPGSSVRTVEGISQRMALIDQILAFDTDPSAVQLLTRAREDLSKSLVGAASKPATAK